MAKVIKGSGQVVKRGADGKLSATRGSNYAGVSNQTMRDDRKVASGTGNGSYGSGVAPRVGSSTPAKKGPGVTVNYGNSSAINKNKIGKLKK